MAPETKSAAPSISEVFARRLRAAREARRFTQQDLAEALTQLGAPMDRTTIAKLEKRQRQARVEELVAIAAALDIAPVHLFLPIEGDQGAGRERHGPEVMLAPNLGVNQVKARRWARGQIPLEPANFTFYLDQTPGDVSVSTEELSPEEQQRVAEQHRRTLEKMGIGVNQEEPGGTLRGFLPPATASKPGDRPGQRSSKGDNS